MTVEAVTRGCGEKNMPERKAGWGWELVGGKEGKVVGDGVAGPVLGVGAKQRTPARQKAAAGTRGGSGG